MKLNKRIFGILIEDVPLDDLPPELKGAWQTVNLAAGSDHLMLRAVWPRAEQEAHVTFSRAGLLSLKLGLNKAGLDPRFFKWPPEKHPDRPPYRGMSPLEAEDAGIFFGREAPIIEALDRLRGFSEAAPPRFLVILGASGAGKSSFLRAGLFARLARDDRHFLPLPVVRPERAALTGETGLAQSLEAALEAAGIKRSLAEIRVAIAAGVAAVRPLLDELAAKARSLGPDGETREAPPRLVLPIDQSEELFLADGSAEAKAFLRLVRDLAVAEGSNLIVLVTIRSDSYERLQSSSELEGISQQTFSLPPLPRGAYQTVIEGPAERLKEETRRTLKIEPALTTALLTDIEEGGAKDALPLLAFTLERLYTEYGGDGDLKLAEYRLFGGIRGSIEAAVERAFERADGDPAIPKDRAARLALLRRALIPWLAGIDPETQSPRRLVARLSEIPEESRPLVQHLVAERLLATGEHTIEPVHEALLRQWGALRDWLEADFALLAALEGVRRAARDWAANAKSEAWLSHIGSRLDDAEALKQREDFARALDPTERAYLDACRAAETARRDRELEEARKLDEAKSKITTHVRVRLLLAGIIVALGVFGFLKAKEAWDSAAIAEQQTEAAKAEAERARRNETVRLAALSQVALGQGRAVDAVRLALASWPRSGAMDRPPLRQSFDGLVAALPWLRERQRLRGHFLPVWSAVLSPDGSRVLTASSDLTARIWDAQTGGPIAAFVGHSGPVRSALFSVDGKRVVTASHDNTARIWDAATGTEIAVLRAHADRILSAAFSPDGSRVATASYDKTARLWDAATGAEIRVLEGHTDRVLSVAFSPDGSRVVTASSDKTARVWDVPAGREIAVLRHEGVVRSAVFSPDGSRVLTSSHDLTARLWDTTTGKQLVMFKGHVDTVLSAVFSPDGSRVATASADRTGRVWQASTGAEIAVLAGHTGVVRSVAFSPDGLRLATASNDRTAKVWDATTGAEMIALQGHDDVVQSAVFSPDGSRVLTASEDNSVRFWDATTGAAITVLGGHSDAISSAVFSREGSRILTASVDQTARVWDVATGKEKAVISHGGRVWTAVFSRDESRILTASSDNTARVSDAVTGTEIVVLKGHSAFVRSAVYSPDGSRIATASADGTARVWDAATGREIAMLKGHEAEVWFAVFSPDGSRVVTASADATGRIWDAATGAVIAVLKGHRGWVDFPVFSPDGSRILTISPDTTARIWDAATGGEVLVLSGHSARVRAAVFSPDGKRVATGSADNTVRVWDARTGAEIIVLRGHREPVFAVAFSPDGSRLLTASGDRTARLWDSATGAEIALFAGHEGQVWSATFSPDGSRVATASSDHTVRISDISKLEKGDAFAVACQRLGNNTDLSEVRARYDLGEIMPICGDHPPLPVDPTRLE